MFSENDIAIVSVSCRFPDAADPDAFWENLKKGHCSLRDISESDLRANGATSEALEDSNYVKKMVAIDGIDLFDAGFFGFTPKEAQLLDPQQRLFLEVCWEALERAAVRPSQYDGDIGVFAGASFNTYLLSCLDSLKQDKPDLLAKLGGFQSLIHSDKDFIATRTSFKLNLRGPSMTLQSACSTSLLAVHQACQSLLNYECDMALAGGASLSVPQNLGYYYQEGMIFSPDGVCRAFDAGANGTVVGNGVGAVLLKRAVDAYREGDPVVAVIKGSAANNDGSDKVGFTAPSRTGQTAVIEEALGVADVDPATITYVETHGTGTKMGDPIEIGALTNAFNSRAKNVCAIGSLKTNIGHLDAAAGVAGLIKTALMLQNRTLVPSLNFDTPNPEANLANSPFYVSTKTQPWVTPEGTPLRAGVSSFGIGGTNVHLILEEPDASAVPSHQPPPQAYTIIPISAKTDRSVLEYAHKLKSHVEHHDASPIGNIAFTLQHHREPFNKRVALTCSSTADLTEALSRLSLQHVTTVPSAKPRICFLFPGQGSQFPSMFGDLYREGGVFSRTFDECANYLRIKFGLEIQKLIYPENSSHTELAKTDTAQLAIFCVQYSLARTLMDLGITPDMVLGHSIGEYAAACLADVMPLDVALELVYWRGHYMAQMPEGAMLSITCPPEELELPDSVHLAAYNSADTQTVSGPSEAILRYQKTLEDRQTPTRILKTSHAYHCPMMDAAAKQFENKLIGLNFNSPRIQTVSSQSGKLIEHVHAPEYWAQQIRNPVKFHQAMQSALDHLSSGASDHTAPGPIITLEIGPGTQLSSLVKRSFSSEAITPISCSRTPTQKDDDAKVFYATVARLWERGSEVNWQQISPNNRFRKLCLPTYAFDRKSHWIGSITGACPIVPGENVSLDFLDFTALGEKRPALSTIYTQPTTAIHVSLVDVWRDHLGLEMIGIDDDYYELGGDSLQLTQILSAINGLFGLNIKTSELRTANTIRELANVVETKAMDFVRSLSNEEAESLLNTYS